MSQLVQLTGALWSQPHVADATGVLCFVPPYGGDSGRSLVPSTEWMAWPGSWPPEDRSSLNVQGAIHLVICGTRGAPWSWAAPWSWEETGTYKAQGSGAGRVVRQMDGFVVVLGYVKGSVRES